MNTHTLAGFNPQRTGGSFDEWVIGRLQSDADFFAVVFGEVNAGLLKGFLNFEDGRDVSFHDALVLFDALQGCQANPSPASKLARTSA